MNLPEHEDKNCNSSITVATKIGNDSVELVMPPMNKEAELDKRRTANYLLDMIIKYGNVVFDD